MAVIKVVEFVTGLNDGGAETLVKDYARLIDKEKFKVSVIVIRHYNHTANTKILKDLNVPILPIYPHWNIFVRVFNKLLGRFYVPYRLKKILKQEDADVMHAHLEVLKYIGAISEQIKDMRLLYTCHNLPHLFFCGRRAAEGAAARNLIEHNGLQLIALHDDMKNEINEMFGIKNTVVLRNGVDFNRFLSVDISKDEIRSKLRIPADAYVVGHVGRFSEQKNHPFLVEVFREIASRNRDAYLLMVGAGNKGAIEQKLHTYGLQERYQILSNRTDVNELMRAMDVFVFPSLFEGLSVTLIEAQVSDLRCVISDKIVRESIKKDNVIALPLKDPARWAEVALDRTIKGKAYGSIDDYDMNREIKRLEKLYAGEWDE